MTLNEVVRKDIRMWSYKEHGFNGTKMKSRAHIDDEEMTNLQIAYRNINHWHWLERTPHIVVRFIGCCMLKETSNSLWSVFFFLSSSCVSISFLTANNLPAMHSFPLTNTPPADTTTETHNEIILSIFFVYQVAVHLHDVEIQHHMLLILTFWEQYRTWCPCYYRLLQVNQTMWYLYMLEQNLKSDFSKINQHCKIWFARCTNSMTLYQY